MENPDRIGPVAAAAELEQNAKIVAESVRRLASRSDVTDVLDALRRAQQETSRVYAALAAWHGAAEREHETEAHHPRNPGWRRAEVALEEAAQYAADASTALQRAWDAAMSARWFEEIRTDE